MSDVHEVDCRRKITLLTLLKKRGCDFEASLCDGIWTLKPLGDSREATEKFQTTYAVLCELAVKGDIDFARSPHLSNDDGDGWVDWISVIDRSDTGGSKVD